MTTDITEAYAEWDDPAQTFRVYLVRGDDVDNAQPMEARITDGSVEARLYKAAFVARWRDFDGPHERVLGFEKEAAAKRVAKAVNAELRRIAKGEPGPTDHDVHMTAQIAQVLTRKRRR